MIVDSILKKQKKYILIIIGIISFLFCICFFVKNINAADTSDFDAGNIISDAVFYNSDTMSVDDIQDFLDSKVTSCDTYHTGFTGSTGTVYNPPWICLKDYYENPNSTYTVSYSYLNTSGDTKTDSRTYYYNNAYKYTKLTAVYVDNDHTQGVDHLKATIQSVGGTIPSNGISAAQIIYNIAKEYGINPQVLLVLLQKEQGLITDTWPSSWQYQAATGYGCPDYQPCSANYAGFSKQVASAAWQFKAYQANPTNYSYVAGKYNTIKWNPSTSCGTSSVYIKNQATAGLYNYTPYRPNQAALDAGYGTGDSCSSYGNRNFWLYFTDWFGSTHYTVVGEIAEKYDELGGKNSDLGDPTSNQTCNSDSTKCYQRFKNGYILWKEGVGAYESKGAIRTRYLEISSTIGYPVSDETCKSGDYCYQKYENGIIIWNRSTGAWEVTGKIRVTYSALGFTSGELGFPVRGITCYSDSKCYQKYENGYILWKEGVGAYESKGAIRNEYITLNGSAGYPTSNEVCSSSTYCYQRYENSIIIWNQDTGAWELTGPIRSAYSRLGFTGSTLSWPVADQVCNLSNTKCYQKFKNGYVLWKEGVGAYESKGAIRNEYLTLSGAAGYPTSDEVCNSTNTYCYQTYENGKITWKSGSSAIYTKY